MKISTVGFLIVDGLATAHTDTLRDTSKDAIEAYVRKQAEITGAIAEKGINELWYAYEEKWGAQCVAVEVKSENIEIKPPGILKIRDDE